MSFNIDIEPSDGTGVRYGNYNYNGKTHTIMIIEGEDIQCHIEGEHLPSEVRSKLEEEIIKSL